MIHVLTDKEYYREKTCRHDYCLGHKPDWKNIGEKYLKKNMRRIFLLGLKMKALSRTKHCEQKMLRRIRVVDQQCQHCGRKHTKILDYFVLLCGCCGFTDTLRGDIW